MSERSIMLSCENVSVRYQTGDFKNIGLKEWVMRRLTGRYKVVDFWANRNISFTLGKGDMLGIVGANGAGKSTLLKILAGIMEPTDGRVVRNGQVAALLELASGFDGDLTVKENAYLRGAMLGYTRAFMDVTYPDIIAFAELEEFEDRPFKQLSSGMKSRLAFSVASLVKPEILILDEVLSVGDGAFKAKSEAKMREILKSGATTILVSHSTAQVRSLCNKVLWLDHGRQIVFTDDVEGACDSYEEFLRNRDAPPVYVPKAREALRRRKASVAQSGEEGQVNNPAAVPRAMYVLGYESMARSMNGFVEMFHSPDFAERRAKLVAGLPEDSVAAVDLILQRLKIILESKGVASVDLYTDEEQREFAAAKQILQSKIVQIGPNLYVWNGYALPYRHFEPNVFLDGYGFRFIKTLGDIGDKAIIDAGAYIGDSALMLAPLTKGKVFAFEPMQDNFRLLQKTKLLNGLDNVIPVHKALGDCEGTLTMTVGNAGACATMQNRLPDGYLRQETVDVVKLDDFVKSQGLSVGMIKTDVEGAEQLLLRGAKEVIQRDRPILLISIYHNASDFLDIKPLIESWGLQYQFKIYHPPIKNISGETVLIAECGQNQRSDRQGPVVPVPELENSNRRLWRMCAEVVAADKAD